MLHQGYLVWTFEQTSPPDLTPHFRVPSYITRVGGDYGAGLYSAHGSSTGEGVTPFAHTTAGYNAAVAERDLQNATYPGLCYVAMTDYDYHVSVNYGVLFGYTRFAEGAIFHNDSCHGGDAIGWLGS
jgi:hypothetical protein